MNATPEFEHLDGTLCVAGHLSSTRECVEGGGIVRHRIPIDAAIMTDVRMLLLGGGSVTLEQVDRLAPDIARHFMGYVAAAEKRAAARGIRAYVDANFGTNIGITDANTLEAFARKIESGEVSL